MIIYNTLYQILKDNYKDCRFENSPNKKDYPTYATDVCKSSFDYLNKHKKVYINKYDSKENCYILIDESGAVKNISDTDWTNCSLNNSGF